jgi:hypothetical protein
MASSARMVRYPSRALRASVDQVMGDARQDDGMPARHLSVGGRQLPEPRECRGVPSLAGGRLNGTRPAPLASCCSDRSRGGRRVLAMLTNPMRPQCPQ